MTADCCPTILYANARAGAWWPGRGLQHLATNPQRGRPSAFIGDAKSRFVKQSDRDPPPPEAFMD